jgi:hypothetical protein
MVVVDDDWFGYDPLFDDTTRKINTIASLDESDTSFDSKKDSTDSNIVESSDHTSDVQDDDKSSNSSREQQQQQPELLLSLNPNFTHSNKYNGDEGSETVYYSASSTLFDYSYFNSMSHTNWNEHSDRTNSKNDYCGGSITSRSTITYKKRERTNTTRRRKATKTLMTERR